MRERQQNSTAYPITFFLTSSSDHITGATGLTPTVTISKNGGAFASPSGAVSEIGNGWYALAGNLTDRNTLGSLLIHVAATGADAADLQYAVVGYDPFDGVRLGLTSLPNATPGASGGVFIAGTNAATTANITGNLTGNVSGSVGSVSGNVGGSVGSVAGNVGGIVVGSVGSVGSPVTVGTNNDKSGYSLAVTPPTAAQVATAVWTDATSSDFATSGTPGKILVGQLGGAFTTASSSVYTTAALANAPAGGGGSSDPLANPVPGSYAVGTAGYALGHGIPLPANGLDAVVAETGVNARQALALILDGVFAKLTGATTSSITIYDAPTGNTPRAVVAVDGNGNRTTNPTLTPPA